MPFKLQKLKKMKEERKHKGSHPHKKVLRIKVIPAKMMYEKIQNNGENDVKMRTEREMAMTTDLLAEAGIEEPKMLGIRTGTLLKAYLSVCTILNLFTMMAVSGGRLKFFYLIKSMFAFFGLYTLTDSVHFQSNLIFSVLFGASVLLESIPCVAGILVLFSRDVCSVLAGIKSDSSVKENEEFLKFCRKNVDSVRAIGSAVIVTELLIDSLVFLQLVQYQRYLRQVQQEKTTLNYYNGKERIALP